MQQLVRLPRGAKLTHIAGLAVPSNIAARALPSATIQNKPNIAALTRHLPNIWGVHPYALHMGVQSADGEFALAYDVIGGRPLRVLTSQRCGKPCYWCRSPKAIAPRKPDVVIDEIQQHYDDFDSIHFEDNDVWFDPENFRRIGERMIEHGLNTKSALVKTTTDRISSDRVDFLGRMGVRTVAFGVESFSQRCLDLLHKKTTVEQNHQAIQLVLAAGMKPGINAIWCVPGVDLSTTRELVLSVIPYLKVGAYLNLVPELVLEDIRLTPTIRRLIAAGYIRNEPRRFPGASDCLDYLVLDLPDAMRRFRDAALRRTESEVVVHMRAHRVRNISVAVWSLFLLRSIVQEFPSGFDLTEQERADATVDVNAILAMVLNAEAKHTHLYHGVVG